MRCDVVSARGVRCNGWEFWCSLPKRMQALRQTLYLGLRCCECGIVQNQTLRIYSLVSLNIQRRSIHLRQSIAVRGLVN